jgi:Na+/phosphate symporter
LTRQGVLASTEEELLHQLEVKTKGEVERQHAVEEKAKHKVAAEQQSTYAQEVIHADLVATFGRTAREAASSAEAIMDQALEAQEKASAKSEASMANASAMRE